MPPPSGLARIPASSPKARHPSQPLYTLLVALGGSLAGLGLLLALVGAYVGLAYAVFGGLVMGLGLFGRRVGSGVLLVNGSLAKLSQGRLEESEALLDRVEAENKLGYLLRPLLVQRTMIALRRGDTRAALAAADRAVAVPLGLFGRAAARIHRIHALALRAVVKASEGDAEGALRDAAEVRASPDAAAQALARAALAEVLVLERRGERAELRERLELHRYLLEQGTEPRERAIVRAMQRMLRAQASTVYRVAPVPANPGRRDEPAISEWLERIAPGLAAFGPAEQAPHDARAVDEPLARSAKPPARGKVARPRRRRWDVRIISAAAIGTILYVVWGIATPRSVDGGAPPAGPAAFELLVLMTLLIVATLGYRVLKARGEGKALLAATAGLARGEENESAAVLARLSDNGLELIAAQADLALSALAEQKGDIPLALSTCDRGLGRLTHYGTRIAAADLLTPELAAQRAFLLTALDRHDEAAAELAAIPEGFAFRPRAVFRVEVLRRVRTEGVARAAEYVGGGAVDRMLSARDELLADVVRAAARPELAGPGEILRLRDELRNPSRHRAWLEQIAPTALDAFDRLDEDAGGLSPEAAAGLRGARITTGDDATRHSEASAEAEAAAEEEAAESRAGRALLASSPKSE